MPAVGYEVTNLESKSEESKKSSSEKKIVENTLVVMRPHHVSTSSISSERNSATSATSATGSARAERYDWTRHQCCVLNQRNSSTLANTRFDRSRGSGFHHNKIDKAFA